MVCHCIDCVVVKCGIFIVDSTVGQENDVVFAGRVEYGIVVNIVIVSFDHQSTSSIPDYIVMHGSVSPFTCLTYWCIKASTVLDYIVNPVVGDFSTRCFSLHYLYNRSISLQVANIPHSVVEYFWRISN